MKLAIMQPYFFPYVGYFSLIAASDKLILFDTAQYIRHGWVNRNRILKPSKDDWQYITAPLQKHHRETPISEILVKDDGWENKMLAQLQHYKKRAPYYRETTQIIKEVLLAEYSDKRIVLRIAKAMELVCNYCNLPLEQSLFSEMELDIETAREPDEWALNICRAMKADGYVNPEGGLDFFNQTKYDHAGISIQFLQNKLRHYNQPNDEFIAGLSIIDVLMFNGPDETKRLIENYTFIDREKTEPRGDFSC